MNLQQKFDRARVLALVEESIQQGMDRDSIEKYCAAAEEYGQKYKVEDIVRDWAKKGRRVFYSPEAARDWAKTLP
ncbi:hypothetical protein LEP3755_25730 [Leptolyngbya sp. NIES-3755]|nr:hypothetical protein LEP3755_25730 [Leptolyngbya sp. NIES-3755]